MKKLVKKILVGGGPLHHQFSHERVGHRYLFSPGRPGGPNHPSLVLEEVGGRSSQRRLYQSFLRVNRIPLDIFSRRVQFIFTYLLPLAFLVLFPTQTLLGKLPPYLILLAPLFAALHFFLAVKFWHLGLRRYSSASS